MVLNDKHPHPAQPPTMTSAPHATRARAGLALLTRHCSRRAQSTADLRPSRRHRQGAARGQDTDQNGRSLRDGAGRFRAGLLAANGQIPMTSTARQDKRACRFAGRPYQSRHGPYFFTLRTTSVPLTARRWRPPAPNHQMVQPTSPARVSPTEDCDAISTWPCQRGSSGCFLGP